MNKTLRAIYLYNSIFVLAASLLGPLYAVFVATFEKNIFNISLSWAAFVVATLIFTWLVSRVGDRLSKKKLLLAGFLVRAVVWGLYAVVPNIYFLIALQVALGLGEALGSPAFCAIVAEHLDRGRHIANYSQWQLYSNGVIAVGTVLGGLVVVTLGFQVLFLLMAVLALVSSLGILRQPDELFD